ncbi:10895_t:CDS:2 [Cetraspora pellucida]|uniref:10895_t:CDS:1 n=1 Tax=Cetraspora pellucida TaxID=1433469 RepID=A0A9N9NKS8_9GLOM|nr:10895_t:CDS:2 [Cetraspora pellucida]
MNISTSVSDILNQILNSCCICQEPIKKPVTVLECDHILHFNCAIEFFAISENITCPVKNCQNRIKNIEAVKKDISDLAEALKPGNTPKVRSFLQEISKDLPHSDASSEMKEIPPLTVQGFLLLYVNIDQAEELLAHSERNVVRAKKENKIVAEVKKLLPNEIEFIKTGDNKSKFRIERKSSNIWTDFDVLQSNDPKGLNSGTNSLESNYTIDNSWGGAIVSLGGGAIISLGGGSIVSLGGSSIVSLGGGIVSLGGSAIFSAYFMVLNKKYSK